MGCGEATAGARPSFVVFTFPKESCLRFKDPTSGLQGARILGPKILADGFDSILS